MITWIPFWQWNSWSPAERGEVMAFYENTGQKWAIDLTQDKPDNSAQESFQKDRDEYNEEMSLGGRKFKTP